MPRFPIVAKGYIENGRLKLDDEFEFKALIRKCENQRVAVRVGPPIRSEEANNYYWLILGLIEDHVEKMHDSGHTAEDFHEFFKRHFLPKSMAIVDGNGEIVGEEVVGGSTTKTNSREFYDYVENVRHWALMRLGLETPDPDPRLGRKWKKFAELKAAEAAMKRPA